MDGRNAIRHYLGAASLAFGVVGILKPGLPAKLTGSTRDEARELGFRDLLIGFGIYAAPRIGVTQRALADLGDAFSFARRKPAVVPVALGTAAISAYYVLSGR